MVQRVTDRAAAVRDALEALAGWQVLVAQYNDLVARSLGVTPTETQCLYVLSRFGPSTPGELARRINLTTGATTRMLDRLLAAGYVTRTPDPRDRRRVIIEPAGDGIARVAACYEPLNADLAGLLTDFDEAALGRLADFARAAEDVTEQRIRGM
jgi:DNA-binding MarR family transcriptional regulator